MHVVILGCGRVGSALSVQLTKAGHSVAVIDKRAEAFDRLPPGFEAQTVVGIGFDRDVLEEAGIKNAAQDGAFVAVSNGDNSNIVAARIAREHYHVQRVVARIYDPRRAEIYERLNIPTVASARWAAQQIQYLLFHGKEELKESFAGGTLLHLQKDVPDHLVGKPVSSVEKGGAVLVAGVDRGGMGFIPVENSTFQQGDVAHFVLTQDAIDQLDILLQPVAE
ncbi:MAG TPA: TrkA family potassium uptake protein [Actinomycetota bacterium]|nr:TrkA family potassium uptake protein [Actinomycetota bacterium]